MSVPPITALPPPPLRSQSPATFTTTAENFVDALPDFVDEMNDAIAEINALDFATTTWKGAVRVATTAAGTIGSSFANGSTVDGVTLVTGDRILIKNQAAPAENGIYIVNASGSPTRAADMNANDEVLGAVVFVIAGTANANKIFFSTNTSAVTIGSTALNFDEFTGAGASTTQTEEQISGFIASPSDKSYTIALKMAHGGTITEATTKSVSGTCTATFKVNSTALGGTANSVSSSEQSQSHSGTNTFVAGDDIVLTVSSNSSCTDMSFTIKYTRVLA